MRLVKRRLCPRLILLLPASSSTQNLPFPPQKGYGECTSMRTKRHDTLKV